MSGIVGSYFNTRGSGIVAKLGTDGQVFTSTGAGLSQGFEAAAGGVNTPAFEAYLSANQGVSDATWVKVAFDTEVFDSDGTYDHSSNYRYTPATAGKYFCYTGIRAGNDGADTLSHNMLAFYKNGAAYLINTTPTVLLNANSATQTNFGHMLTQTLDLDDDDYVEAYVYVDTSTGSPDLIHGSFFGAYKIIT